MTKVCALKQDIQGLKSQQRRPSLSGVTPEDMLLNLSQINHAEQAKEELKIQMLMSMMKGDQMAAQ